MDVFKQVLDHYGGNNLPAMEYLSNTLENQFGIAAEQQDEFVELFTTNCRFLGIGHDLPTPGSQNARPANGVSDGRGNGDHAVTVAVPHEGSTDELVCFVIMPFTERHDDHPPGFFSEVLRQLFTPAATKCGFTVRTAHRQGSDVIQSTIVNELLEADLVLADLTEHNPIVLFELGMRMAEDKPVALVRAKGTGPIFDIDNMLRV